MSIKAIIPEEEVKPKEKERTGNPVYSDDLFKAVLNVINNDPNSKRNGIKVSQYGTKLTIYQGNPANVWGYVEALNAEFEKKELKHRIRIFSSILRKIFLKNDETKKYFEEVI